jgi:hypothetical protein
MQYDTFRDTYKVNDIYNPRKGIETWMKAESNQIDPSRYTKKITVFDPTILPASEAHRDHLKAWKSDKLNSYKFVPHIDYLPKWSPGHWEVEETGYCNINLNKFFK